MGNQVNFYSFEKWCIDTGNEDLLEIWDYELNDISPSDIGYMSIKKIWFKCSYDLHESNQIILQAITKSRNQGKEYTICKGCNSIGQYIINNYSKEYLDSIWSEQNEEDCYLVQKSSKKKIWLKCLENSNHPDYSLTANNFSNSHNCPYCVGKKVCKENSIGHNHPKAINVWSELNEDKTPFDYTSGSHAKVWWKCENGIHDDYQRAIYQSLSRDFNCPKCGFDNRKIVKGSSHPYWKGGTRTDAEIMRKSKEYAEWRTKVYEKDYYTCQCCGTTGHKLVAHHILDFANHIEDRLNIDNGITLCCNCHDSTIEGSFHNTYGTHEKSKEELEEYINLKRKSIKLNIPFDINSYISGNRLMPKYLFDYNDLYVHSFSTSTVCSVENFIAIKPRFRV